MPVHGEAAQVEDGIADKLSGSVVGDVSAAIDLVNLDTAVGEEFIAGENVGARGVASHGEDRRVFEQNERVADAVLVARFDELLLDVESGGVVDTAEMDEVEDHWRPISGMDKPRQILRASRSAISL